MNKLGSQLYKHDNNCHAIGALFLILMHSKVILKKMK